MANERKGEETFMGVASTTWVTESTRERNGERKKERRKEVIKPENMRKQAQKATQKGGETDNLENRVAEDGEWESRLVRIPQEKW